MTAHNQAPVAGDVDDVLTAIDGFHDRGSDLIHVGEAFVALHAFGHRGPHRTGLDGHHVDAFAVDAIAQAVDKRRQAGLRAAIDVVGFAAALAGDGAEYRERSGVALRAVVREPCKQTDRRGVVGVNDVRGVAESCVQPSD